MIWFPCADACEEKSQWVCRDGLRAHSFSRMVLLAREGGTILEEFVEIRCESCGGIATLEEAEWAQACADQDKDAARRRKAGLTRYPYIEPQSGVLVKSKEDRDRVWAAKGYKEWKHDGDESGFSETDHQIKERYKPREPGWRKLASKIGA